jgi:hypothetical protein
MAAKCAREGRVQEWGDGVSNREWGVSLGRPNNCDRAQSKASERVRVRTNRSGRQRQCDAHVPWGVTL